MEVTKLQPIVVRYTVCYCWIFRKTFLWILVPACNTSENIQCVNPGSGRKCILKSWMCDGVRYLAFENVLLSMTVIWFSDCQDNSDEDTNYCSKANSFSLAINNCVKCSKIWLCYSQLSQPQQQLLHGHQKSVSVYSVFRFILIVLLLVCSPNPCWNGATCVVINGNSDYYCICPSNVPLTGKNCDQLLPTTTTAG
jgi:EGF-like domain